MENFIFCAVAGVEKGFKLWVAFSFICFNFKGIAKSHLGQNSKHEFSYIGMVYVNMTSKNIEILDKQTLFQ